MDWCQKTLGRLFQLRKRTHDEIIALRFHISKLESEGGCWGILMVGGLSMSSAFLAQSIFFKDLYNRRVARYSLFGSLFTSVVSTYQVMKYYDLFVKMGDILEKHEDIYYDATKLRDQCALQEKLKESNISDMAFDQSLRLLEKRDNEAFEQLYQLDTEYNSGEYRPFHLENTTMYKPKLNIEQYHRLKKEWFEDEKKFMLDNGWDPKRLPQ